MPAPGLVPAEVCATSNTYAHRQNKIDFTLVLLLLQHFMDGFWLLLAIEPTMWSLLLFRRADAREM
jgi:hypothetical protein